jgi:hypothetical protein
MMAFGGAKNGILAILAGAFLFNNHFFVHV